jgi:D-cysteine desulfhydrase
MKILLKVKIMNEPKKVLLANLPTPLQVKKFSNKEFLIKRDDLTGVELTGNKVRKMEYLLKGAMDAKADVVFTTGAEQSNHARATAIACTQLGINCKLFLWGKDSANPVGNLFLDKVAGAQIKFYSKKEYSGIESIMSREEALLKKKNKKAYLIPGGGSSTLGIWGYISFYDELAQQTDLKKLEGVWAACGSGGTAAGLLVGAALKKLPLKVYAVNVLMQKDAIRKYILELAEKCILEYNLNVKIDPDKLVIVDGYSAEGYKKIEQSKVKVITRLARECGIFLDPAYTGKAFYAYNELVINKNLGKKIMFIHTGGIFGMFCKAKQYLK